MSNFEDFETWRDEAACVGSDTEIFFSDDSKYSTVTQREMEKQAKLICAECVVRDDCLDYAVTNGITTGTWGGMSAADRRKALKATRTVTKGT
jgi:WhiB family redox-sensing transcriptional regulator